MEVYEIRNDNNAKVKILNFGARVLSIEIGNTKGNLINSVLRYNFVEDYKNDKQYLGGIIGRYANRIAEGRCIINNRLVKLSVNEKNNHNHLHGGRFGFDKKYWEVVNHNRSSIELILFSEDGDEGYPGNLSVNIQYILLENDTLKINFKAKTDKPTIINLTNHSYFNLSDKKKTIDNHQIKVRAKHYTPLDQKFIPKYPYIKSVTNSIYNLQAFQRIKDIKKDICNSNYLFDNGKKLREMATITDLISGRKLTISSDYPAMQLYFGNFLSGEFTPFQGLCCEPQYSPNSPNLNVFPKATLLPNETYSHTIEYKFERFRN